MNFLAIIELMFAYPGLTMSAANEHFCVINETCGVDVEIMKNEV